jgi:hypothetical protein
MGRPLTIITVVLVLLLGAVGALLYVANTAEPPQTEREEVIPNDRFPG